MKNQPTPTELLIAIHKHCLECSGGSRKEVSRCSLKNCSLWLYREPEATRKPKKVKGQMSVFEMMKEAK